MLKKSFLILIGGFAIQFLFSCNNCEPIPTLKMVHTEISLNTAAVVNDRLRYNEDTVHKENFRLEIYLRHQRESLSQAKKSFYFGFNAAQAWECSEPLYTYSDKVESLSIVMINQADTSQTIDVTSIFGENYESETHSIQDLIDFQYEVKKQFYLYLSLLEYDSIYQNASFRVIATLESGKTFTQETEEIVFMD